MKITLSRDFQGVIMALRVWASLARLDKLKLIPRGACFSLLAGRQPSLGPRATKGDEARPAMFFDRAERAPMVRFLAVAAPQPPSL
jgi:hypothetical protein